jgi:hypothetical protein
MATGTMDRPTHKTAAVKEVEVRTEPLTALVGATAETLSPRPDLAGLRVKTPNAPQIYLIDPNGFRRWIPDPATYNNLFRDWNGVVIDINVSEIAQAASLTPGAVIFKSSDHTSIYLVSNGCKRWITSPAAMDKYYFDWGKVLVLPPVVVDFVPEGQPWS